MLRVVAFASSLDSAAFRYRVGQFIEPLGRLGVAVEPRPVPASRAERRRAFAEAARFDVAWLQRRTFGMLDAHNLRRQARRLVFDFDDALWQRDSNRRVGLSLKRQVRFQRAVRMADVVVAGNEALAERARRFAETVEVVPTCVEVGRYRPRSDHTAGGALDLVWIGQSSTLGYLQSVLPALEAFAARRPARLRVISDVFPESRCLEIVPVPWQQETEAAELAAAHVGLAPLPEDPWARGKCGLKVLQYMAAGLPVVASPVGVQAGMVGRDERGRLAASPEEWVRCLTALADDAAERERLGRAGRRFVQERYAVAVWAPKLAGILRAAGGPRPVP